MEQGAHIALEQGVKRLAFRQVRRDPLHAVPVVVDIQDLPELNGLWRRVRVRKVSRPDFPAFFQQVLDYVVSRKPASAGDHIYFHMDPLFSQKNFVSRLTKIAHQHGPGQARAV